MEFNLQDYLRDMREEQQQDHRDLSTKIESVSTAMLARIDTVNNRVSKQDTRLVVVENMRRGLIFLGTALITALLAFVGDLILNHLPHAAAAAVITVGGRK